MTENIPEKVHLAQLPSDALKMFPDGTLDSPSLQILQLRVPGGFIFTLSKSRPKIYRCPLAVMPVAINAAMGDTLSRLFGP